MKSRANVILRVSFVVLFFLSMFAAASVTGSVGSVSAADRRHDRCKRRCEEVYDRRRRECRRIRGRERHRCEEDAKNDRDRCKDRCR